MKCNYEECSRHSVTKGYCSAHYAQYKKGQELRPIRPYGVRRWTPEQRLLTHNQRKYIISKEAKPAVIDALKAKYGDRGVKDLAIAYACEHHTWESMFEGSYVIQDDCYLWNKGLFKTNGYGQKGIYHPDVSGSLSSVMVHRLSYALAYGIDELPWGRSGPLADTKVIDHICNNTLCINPVHLRVLTSANNLSRGKKLKRGQTA